MAGITLRYLSGADIEAVAMTGHEILAAVEAGLQAQGRGQTVIEPRMHLIPDPAFHGHFNILRGYIAPLGVAGVKIVGDYEHHYQAGLPSEFALLNLMDAKTGAPFFEGQELEGLKQVYASPVGVAGRIYFADREGNFMVIKQSDTFEVLATNKLDDEFDASPVVVGDELYLKGARNLYCSAKQ